MTLTAHLPPMPLRIIIVQADSGPAEIRCSSDGRGGKGCGLFLMLVERVPIVAGEGVILGAAERWECWSCWRAIEVRWGPAFEAKEIVP